jgi:hypothetical protein
MEAAGSSIMLANIHQITQRHIPQDSNLVATKDGIFTTLSKEPTATKFLA